jgi:hypothetical protein
VERRRSGSGWAHSSTSCSPVSWSGAARVEATRPPAAPHWLGAFLDGIPEQLVLGIGIAAGAGVSVGLLVAIFVSNLPEAIGSANDMRQEGTTVRAIRALWLGVATLCALATTKTGRVAGPATTLGFAVAAGLSTTSA